MGSFVRIEIFFKNRNIDEKKTKFSSKIVILIKNRNYRAKSKFSLQKWEFL